MYSKRHKKTLHNALYAPLRTENKNEDFPPYRFRFRDRSRRSGWSQVHDVRCGYATLESDPALPAQRPGLQVIIQGALSERGRLAL